MTDTLQSEREALREQVIAWRRYLHQHPELSFQEHRTAAFVEARLREMPNLTVTRPTPTSVLATLKGQAGPGRTVLLRADMDALPIQEETGLAFASQNPGVMHACGHDGHTAMLLGAAQVLSAHPENLHGEVRFIFQHAEEAFPGGAQQVVDAGIMDGVDVVVGTHLMSPIPTGVVVLREGPLLAAPDGFEITLRGKGGHGANPHETVDPVVIAAQVILAFQTIISRQRDPLEPAVLSVTQIHGGTAHNVIPDSVTLGGTVRTFDPELREWIPRQMERLLRGITDAYGASYTLDYRQGYRALHNDPATTGLLREVVRDTLGSEVTLLEGKPNMGGEDFSAYLTKAPGTFIIIGAGNVEEGITAPHHHPRFTIDERALEYGVELYVAAARRLTQPTA
ncbi:amidohydrolase [Deinococcus metallilatus]|uniref:Amidohydrolase n=1 Tax=Deinococcus metallilatus TaxID=1211322 RepID=A0AAJ5F3G2_9DEIO|nr:M20 family metallopeptidase [Deinococcus metallilatus]MBB5294201.1 amidohydrolase [Deinococcus metallilatus]QBY08980.1 amidohydrolase [Deinococcus metallilatus]RXJ10124.1 amidohydrolase [Deinococcus metallilatus]TLK27939.1 amidohydrolase [Deinococcus metallilatus]GMA16462.1 N-acyl-L-amino acid amidohydrolase [Deinococcus metallilatus]